MASDSKTVGSVALDSSLQVADVIVVSVDTRGFHLATQLARQGWKTVVIELTGLAANTDLEWADRIGPFLPWIGDAQTGKSSDRDEHHAAMWLPSGTITFGGFKAEASRAHLALRYGVQGDEKKTATLQNSWPEVMMRSLMSSRLVRREAYLETLGSAKGMRVPFEAPIRDGVQAAMCARSRRSTALEAGVRVLEADQVSAVRLSDARVDRIEYRNSEGLFQERTRSMVWMLSEEESHRVDYVGPGVPLKELFHAGCSEPLMAWWRSRIAIRGQKSAGSKTLASVPETPAHIAVIGSIERPWTHDNVALLDLVEESAQLRVFDVWIRIPYWSRADHVYRDEQRLLVQELLSDRFVGCELVWVTPSPLALAAPAVRMPHVVYGEATVPAKGRVENLCFAGPETWPGVGLLGLQKMEDEWIRELERMRIQWDPLARLQASRMERFKHGFKDSLKNIGRTKATNDSDKNEEVSP